MRTRHFHHLAESNCQATYCVQVISCGMADDEGNAGDAGAGEASGGAVAVYQPFVIMEELLDKLKLLHYDDNFCRQLGLKPFSR